MINIGFIGSGNMGGAIAGAAARTGNADIYVYDKCEAKARELADAIGGTYITPAEMLERCELIFLAVKPDILPCVAKEISVSKDTTLVSMAAGVKISRLTELFGEVPIIRIMPNTPVAVGAGVTVYAKNSLVDDNACKDFLSVMACAGIVEELPEEKIDASTALAGCGPAFVYMFAEALADGAVSCGLSRDAAMRYAAGMIEGAAKLLKCDGRHPGELKDAVCSPGGSTIEGVHSLELSGFRGAVSEAVIAAYKKTKSLGK